MTKSHSRHISAKTAAHTGLNVTRLEDDADLQDAVLSVHHATLQTLTSTAAYKIIENHLGKTMVMSAQQMMRSG